MRKRCTVLTIAFATMLGGMAFAQGPAEDATTAADQTPAPQAPAAQTPAAAPAPPPKSAFTQGGMDFSFLFDGYVNGSFNNPDSGMNQLRNFDVRANNAHVSLGKITIDRGPAPVGFHLDVGFGQTIQYGRQCRHAGHRRDSATSSRPMWTSSRRPCTVSRSMSASS